MAGALDKHQVMIKPVNMAPLFLSAHPQLLAFLTGKLRQVVLCPASLLLPCASGEYRPRLLTALALSGRCSKAPAKLGMRS